MTAGFWIALAWLVLLIVACELSGRERRRELWRGLMSVLLGLTLAVRRRF